MARAHRGHHDGRMDQRRFTLDGHDETWPAVRFGEPWNGFATPVVTRSTLASLLEATGDGYRWEGDVAFVWPTIDLVQDDEPDPDSVDRLEPDAEGHYDLGALGWVFVAVRSTPEADPGSIGHYRPAAPFVACERVQVVEKPRPESVGSEPR